MSQVSGVGADRSSHVLFAPGRVFEEVRELADLEDAGAFTSTAAWSIPLGVPRVSLVLPCQAGFGASSTVLLVRPRWVYPDGTESPDGVLDADFATPAPFATRSIFPAEYKVVPPDTALYTPPAIILEVPPGVSELIVDLAEGGDVDHPCKAAVRIGAGS